MRKLDLETMEYLVREMKAAQAEHPKAKVYYEPETNEIRITYPLPQDMLNFKEGYIKNLI